MNIEQLREYCLSKEGAEESFPFGGDVLVFKVKGKIFLLVGLDDQPLAVNVKCDPEVALELRERYTSIRPGYHMNKKHWNTIVLDGSIADTMLQQMITDSYTLVANSKKK